MKERTRDPSGAMKSVDDWMKMTIWALRSAYATEANSMAEAYRGLGLKLKN